jgi:putative tributyrin esterase
MAVFEFTFFSNSLRRTTEVTAIIPAETPMMFPGMAPVDQNKPYKSIYLLHGFSGSHVDWLRSSRIEQLASMHRVAVFCPSGENSFFLDDTVRDAMYGQLIGQELIDFTRRVFPLSHERADTAIGGLSMGGYGAIRNGLKYNEVFGSIIALSSALISDSVARGIEGNPMASASYYTHTFGEPGKIVGSDADPKTLAKKLIDTGAVRPKLFMACGTEDFLLNENRDLDKHLTLIGYPHTYLESPGIHSWAFWDEYIEKALIWFGAFDKQ